VNGHKPTASTTAKSNRSIPVERTSALFIKTEFTRFPIVSLMIATKPVNLWTSPEHARDYLERADSISHRGEGEATLLEFISSGKRRILDLGTGDGRLLALAWQQNPDTEAVAVDFSPSMLEAARKRFAEDPRVTVVAYNMDQPLPDLGKFDAVISSFAIHHLVHERKRALYAEVFELLNPGGVFCNLEHVASPTQRLHEKFLHAIGYTVETEDPSNKLLDVETQLRWLREIGFVDVDCHWKWRELALLAGTRPSSS
jgi:tRNA (cmo5U34)-methyltransferase